MEFKVVIPLRVGSDCNEHGEARFHLDGRPLWDLTIERAVATDKLSEVIIAYDDDVMLQALRAWEGKVRFWKRPSELSRPNATTIDVLSAVAAHLKMQGETPDYLMLLEITHPLRPEGIIGQVVDTVIAQPADSLITARAVHYNMWRPGEEGLVRVHGTAEGGTIFEEMIGICSLFSPKWLETQTPFGDEVDVLPTDRFWAAIDVRDEDALWMAEQYIQRLKSKQ